MDGRWTIEVRSETIERQLRECEATLRAAAIEAFGIKGAQAEERIKRRIRSQFRNRTGAMMGSIAYDVLPGTAGGDLPRLRIGTLADPQRYFWVHEEGATITGRPWLAIPIEHPGNPVLTQNKGAPGGVGGTYARDIRDNPGAFGFKSTFVAKGVIFGVPLGATPRRGLAGLSGTRGWDIVPLFVLKRSVTVPARPFVRPVAVEMAPEIPREIEAQSAARLRGSS